MTPKQKSSARGLKISKEDQSLLDALVNYQALDKGQSAEIKDKFEDAKGTKSIEEIIVDDGYIQPEKLLEIKAAVWKLPLVTLRNQSINTDVLQIIPREIAVHYTVFPLFKLKDKLFLAMARPNDIESIDKISSQVKYKITPALAASDDIRQAIAKYYEDTKKEVFRENLEEDFNEIMEIIEEDQREPEEHVSVNEIERLVGEAPVVRMTNMIINQAIVEDASDIHIIPEENQLTVKIRVDGILKKVYTLPKHIQNGIISRIKILSNLDIAENRIPQDGQIRLRLKDGRKFDMRVSTLPINHGEDVVIRVLRNDLSLLDIENLGFEKDELGKIIKLFDNAFGIVLVTGPTGSGKTTTLYAALNHFITEEKNILTLEDPIEYHFSGIRQSQIHEKSGMTFAKGLRAMLRHDPDVILVGEIRDAETAQIAIQAALTGHLHTNDAVGAVARMIDIGIDPFLISSALIGTAAQRLVRKICKHCQEEYEPLIQIPESFLKSIFTEKEIRKIKFLRGKGCKRCHFTGYNGRIALIETLPVSDRIRRHIVQLDSSERMEKTAIEEGMRPLLHDGWIKVLKGITTLEEVKRVTNVRDLAINA